MKKWCALFLVMAILLLMAGCAEGGTGTEPPEVTGQTGAVTGAESADLMAGIQRGEIPTTGDLTEKGAEVTDFALRLFQESMTEEENTLISPVSVLYALTMTGCGAEGETLRQMESVLGLPVEELKLWLAGYREKTGESESLRLANGIWFTDDARFAVNQDFLQTNADYFDADIRRIPFNSSAVKTINDWTKEKTDGMIPEIVDEVPPEAVMYLVNALAFDAQWQETYEKDQVKDGIFTTQDGEEQKADMMYSTESRYICADDVTGFIKPYAGGTYAFVALLPDEGVSVERYLQNLTGSELQSLLSGAENRAVETAIPKFEAEFSAQMGNVLTEMGMTDAFNEDMADFSGLGSSTAGNIYIRRIIHKTFISVGEQGTSAGASTMVEMADKAAPIETEMPRVYLDRPFVYLIIDGETNIPVFMGVMMTVNP